MAVDMTLTLLEPPPGWFVDGFLGEIDAKTFGERFDACFVTDAEMWFGASHISSLKKIKAHLQEFDSKMDTRHVVDEFWDGPGMKVVKGHLTFTPHASGQTETTQFVHLLRMSREDPDRIEHYFGAAGPAKGL